MHYGKITDEVTDLKCYCTENLISPGSPCRMHTLYKNVNICSLSWNQGNSFSLSPPLLSLSLRYYSYMLPLSMPLGRNEDYSK